MMIDFLSLITGVPTAHEHDADTVHVPADRWQDRVALNVRTGYFTTRARVILLWIRAIHVVARCCAPSRQSPGRRQDVGKEHVPSTRDPPAVHSGIPHDSRGFPPPIHGDPVGRRW
ncbi:hypothetical protein Anae109_2657 [Anaeromyxobacter sp. Fw109-5]|nr:hypothetical protein Anae109_2657 [Anaeromyxobacter sp. Fw109-5]